MATKVNARGDYSEMTNLQLDNNFGSAFILLWFQVPDIRDKLTDLTRNAISNYCFIFVFYWYWLFFDLLRFCCAIKIYIKLLAAGFIVSVSLIASLIGEIACHSYFKGRWCVGMVTLLPIDPFTTQSKVNKFMFDFRL